MVVSCGERPTINAANRETDPSGPGGGDHKHRPAVGANHPGDQDAVGNGPAGEFPSPDGGENTNPDKSSEFPSPDGGEQMNPAVGDDTDVGGDHESEPVDFHGFEDVPSEEGDGRPTMGGGDDGSTEGDVSLTGGDDSSTASEGPTGGESKKIPTPGPIGGSTKAPTDSGSEEIYTGSSTEGPTDGAEVSPTGNPTDGGSSEGPEGTTTDNGSTEGPTEDREGPKEEEGLTDSGPKDVPQVPKESGSKEDDTNRNRQPAKGGLRTSLDFKWDRDDPKGSDEDAKKKELAELMGSGWENHTSFEEQPDSNQEDEEYDDENYGSEEGGGSDYSEYEEYRDKFQKVPYLNDIDKICIS